MFVWLVAAARGKVDKASVKASHWTYDRTSLR